PSRLPNYLTTAHGIEGPVRLLRDRVAQQRLVTVHGPGGSGKTRLAAELLLSLGAEPAHPPFERLLFVPLLACRTEADVRGALAEALAAPAREGWPPIDLLLAGHRLLLLLDNAEQLEPDADAAVGALLERMPELHVLVTSRRLLGLGGESGFEIPPLPLPPPQASLEALAGCPSVALFVDRARAVRADFHLGARNAAAVAALVQWLGGMPLAIELAASRVRSLAPAELLQRLSAEAGSPMLELLKRPRARATSDTRHESMRQMVEWSWRQLDPAQADLLARMSIFTAPALPEAIAFIAGIDADAAQTLLAELQDLSLLDSRPGAGAGWRHGLLQPVREFAAEHCDADCARAGRARLREWLTRQARAVNATRPTAMAPELPHVRAALAQAEADGAQRQALELAVAMRLFWETDLLLSSDLTVLEAALGRVDDPALRGEALELLAHARLQAGDAERAQAHVQAALALPLDDRRRSLVLARWGSVRYGSGLHDAEPERALTQALALARRSGDLLAQAMVLRQLAIVVSNLNYDYAGSERLAHEAQGLWERLGNTRMAYGRLRDRAVMWAWLGRNEDGAQALLACEAAARADGDWLDVILTTRQLGRVYVRMRRWDDATAALRRSIEAAWHRRGLLELTVGLLHLPDALVHTGQADLAARLQGFADALWSRSFGTLNRIQRRELRRTRLLLRWRLGAARFESLRMEGLAWSLPLAVAQALAATVLPM
ncbi:MAG: NACHT domain-containing protein, partial [Burkholderiales bacterium]|nr:NACHT domain-containing protein [Burkholderiales bacterium]